MYTVSSNRNYSKVSPHGDIRVLLPSIPLLLIRFRLRYSPVADCYYLHWDNTVCPQLARIVGLENGVLSASNVSRVENKSEGKVSSGFTVFVVVCLMNKLITLKKT